MASHYSPLFNTFPLEQNRRFVAIDDEIQKLKFIIQPGKIVIEIPLRSISWTIPSNVTATRPSVTRIDYRGFLSNREIFCQGIQTEGWSSEGWFRNAGRAGFVGIRAAAAVAAF